MTRLIALMFCGASHCAAAQFNVTYPYNPDWNGDSLITVMDLQDLLSIYRQRHIAFFKTGSFSRQTR